jgi:hypothetical protein
MKHCEWNLRALEECDSLACLGDVPTIFELSLVHYLATGRDDHIGGRFRFDDEMSIVGQVRQGISACYLKRELEQLNDLTRFALKRAEHFPRKLCSAIANYIFRFGTIHPFVDGNGRTSAMVGCGLLSRAVDVPFAMAMGLWISRYDAYGEAIAADHNLAGVFNITEFLCSIFAQNEDRTKVPGVLSSHSRSGWLWFDKEFVLK